jgi:hypothetical protein
MKLNWKKSVGEFPTGKYLPPTVFSLQVVVFILENIINKKLAATYMLENK